MSSDFSDQRDEERGLQVERERERDNKDISAKVVLERYVHKACLWSMEWNKA